MSAEIAQQRLRALLQQADGLERQRAGVLQEAAALAQAYNIPYAGRRRERERERAARRATSEEARHGHE